jgi:hypothetical protein
MLEIGLKTREFLLWLDIKLRMNYNMISNYIPYIDQ